MSPESFKAIEMAMHIYRRRGATEYRKRQYTGNCTKTKIIDSYTVTFIL